MVKNQTLSEIMSKVVGPTKQIQKAKKPLQPLRARPSATKQTITLTFGDRANSHSGLARVEIGK